MKAKFDTKQRMSVHLKPKLFITTGINDVDVDMHGARYSCITQQAMGSYVRPKNHVPY